MKKYIYLAITNKTATDKLFNRAVRIPSHWNLASILSDPNIYCANVCSSKKEAIALAHAWEDAHIANGMSDYDRNYVTECFDITGRVV